jgi:hypothetical protein
MYLAGRFYSGGAGRLAGAAAETAVQKQAGGRGKGLFAGYGVKDC